MTVERGAVTEGSGAVARRHLRFDSFGAALAEVDRLSTAGYRPAGCWTLAQNLDHLATFMRMSLDGFPALPLPFRPAVWLVRPFLRRSIIKSGNAGRMPAGLPTAPYLRPSGSTEPQSDEDRAAAERFGDVVRRVETHAGEFRPSPLAGRLAPDQWRAVHLTHCAHHLGFLVPLEVPLDPPPRDRPADRG